MNPAISIQHLRAAVIVGKAKTGRTMVTACIVFVVMILIALFAASRNKSAPSNPPPLHPSVSVFFRLSSSRRVV
jgi:hypothetical protein